MKPKPMQSKAKRTGSTNNPDSPVLPKKDEAPTRTIFVRDDERTRTGFPDFGEASDFADTLLKPGNDGSRDSEALRVRVSYRRRTGMYDVVVKAARKVPIVESKAIGE